MLNELRVKGEWFLPSNPTNKIKGTLTFDTKKDPELELFGVFENTEFSTESIDLILGQADGGKYYTLYNSTEIKRTNFMGTNAASTYSSFYVFQGVHYDSKENLLVDSIEGQFKNLTKWMGIYGLNINNDLQNQSFSINYKLPKSRSFKINETLTAVISFNYDVPFMDKTDALPFKQRTYISIQSTIKISFTVMLKHLMKFQNFLTLACYEPAHPLDISVTTIVPNGEKEHDVNSKLIYKPGFNYVADERNRRIDFLFHFNDIENKFESIIQKWYELYEKIEHVFNLLFNNLYLNNASLQNRFLNMAQAIETFHSRLKSDKRPYDPTVFKQWVDKLLTQEAESEFFGVLNESIKQGNRMYFKLRVTDILNEIPYNTISKVVGDKEAYIKKIVLNRNYYTHYDPKDEKKAEQGHGLFLLGEGIKLILITAILKELGFEDSLTSSLLLRNENWHFQALLNKYEKEKAEAEATAKLK